MSNLALKQERFAQLPDHELLELRLKELPVHLEGTFLEKRVRRLYRELEAREICARPHAWLSDEWFTPDGVLGFAIPFYLAHPRLMRLERSQMLEVEGAAEIECRRILRHEAGHALDATYQFYQQPRYRDLFGSHEEPYPSAYTPKPHSRDHVVNLAAWYAQAHPVEDFAETFAVWLTPGLDWRRDYQGWPALGKLHYVDELMRKVRGRPPERSHRAEVEPLKELGQTLREHYRQKRAHYAFDWPANFRQEVRRIFSGDSASGVPATRFIRNHRRELRSLVAEGTGVHAYAVDQLIRDILAQCRAEALEVAGSANIVRDRLIVMLTRQTINVIQSGYPKVAL